MRTFTPPNPDDMMGNCTMCNEHKELRPYGKNNAFVCFECAMKDEEGAALRFLNIISPDTPEHNIQVAMLAKKIKLRECVQGF